MVAGFSPTSMTSRSRSDALPLKGCTATDAEVPALALEPKDPASGRRSSAVDPFRQVPVLLLQSAELRGKAANCVESSSPSVRAVVGIVLGAPGGAGGCGGRGRLGGSLGCALSARVGTRVDQSLVWAQKYIFEH